MNYWKKFKAWIQKRVSPSNPSYWLLKSLGSRETLSGISVSEQNAMESSAVLAASTLLADSVAMLPIKVYQKRADKREELDKHELWDILQIAPNPWMTSFTWRETMMYHLLFKSNSYHHIIRDNGGRVRMIVPLDPARVRAEWDPKADGGIGDLIYKIDGGADPSMRKRSDQILHFRALSWDATTGRDRIDLAGESIGMALGTDRYASSFFGNGAMPPMFLKHPSTLSAQAQERLKADWESRYSGPENRHKPGILEEGMEVQEMGGDPERSQLIEARRENVRDISRIWRVPPHFLSDLADATFSNVEHMGLQYVTFTLAPWLKRIEQELNLKLFTERQRKLGLFLEFEEAALLRGDIMSRYEAYQKSVGKPWMTMNEARVKENMDPLEGGDEVSNPLNMSSGKEAGAGEDKPGTKAEDPPEEKIPNGQEDGP